MRSEHANKAPSRRFGLLFGAAAAVLAGAGAAHAQTAQPAPPAPAQGAEDDVVVVTGSRIKRDPATAPQPLIQLGREDLLASGEANVIDYLADLPALQTSFVAEDSGASLGTGGLSLLDLRNFGPNKTLVLVDGRRHVGSAYFASAAVDIDTIPRLLIENVEVITGGSSAVYGGDAVVGVVNFILRKDFEGAEFDVSLAQLNQDGQLNGRISTLFGRNFLDGRLNAYLSAEYEKAEEVTAADLDWLEENRVTLQNDLDPAAPNNNDGVTDVILGAGYGSIARARGGTLTLARTLQPSATNDPDIGVTPCSVSTADPFNANCFVNDPGFTYTFNSSGIGRPMNFGTGRASAGVNRNNVLGSPDARPLNDVVGTVNRLPEAENIRVQTGFNFDVTPWITAFGEVKYVKDETFSASSPVFFNIGIRPFTSTETTRFFPGTSVSSFTIGLDNAYLDPAIRTLIQNNVRQSFAAPTATAPGAPTTTVADQRALYSNFLSDFSQRKQQNERETFRYVAGLRGDLDSVLILKNVSWEAGYTYSEAEDNNVETLIDSERYAFAADAVIDTAGVLGTPGAVVCRVRLRAAQGVPIPVGADIQRLRPTVRNYSPSDPAIAGCVPFNVFGTSTVPDNVRQYVTAGQDRGFRTEQENFLAFASGDLWDLWGAGAIGLAAGVEGRKETFSGGQGPADRANRVIFGNVYTSTPESSYDAAEYFIETTVPLATDLPGFQKLEFGGAYRVSNYSNIGVTNAWSFQGTWKPIDDITFRYSRGRSVRPPQLNELFRGPAQTFVNISDNCSAPVIAATANAQTRANRIANCAALGIPASYVDPSPTTNNPGVNGPNPNLREEEGTSQTFSVILTPRFAPGLEVILDYYDIQIGNVINTVLVQNLLNLCVDNTAINAAACGLISRNPATFEINSFTQGGFNYASQRAKGIDFAVRYPLDLSDMLDRNVGSLEFGIRGNYSIRRQDFNDVFNPAIATDLDGLIGEPRVRFVTTASWSLGDFIFTWEGDWQASQEIFDDRVLIDDPDQRPPSLLETGDFWQHDFTMRYQLNDRVRFRAGVINAFDNDPSAAAELAPTASLSVAGNSDQFDNFGRRFFAGVNVRF